jgi:hypothetical protein
MPAPPPSPAPAPPPAPSAPPVDPQIAAARAAWVSYGHDPAAFDAAVAGAEPTPAQPSPPALVEIGPDISRASELIQAMVRAGMDPNAIRAAAELDGLAYTPPGLDNRGPDEREYDLAFGRPETPGGYSVNYRGTYAADLPADEFHSLDVGVRDGLHAMGLSPAIGSAVAEMAFQSAEIWQRYDESSRTLYDLKQAADLATLVPNSREAVKNAAALLSLFRDQNPKVFAELTERGAWRSAAVISQLHLQYERMLERLGMAERRTKGAGR